MKVTKCEVLKLETSEDIVRVRLTVRAWMKAQDFSLVDQTKMAASELARNAVDYGGGGAACMEALVDGERSGIRLISKTTARASPTLLSP